VRGETVQRFAVTHVNRDGMRTLTLGCQGRYTYLLHAEAEAIAQALEAHNGPQRIGECYGPQAIGTFRASRVTCYAGHYDPIGIYWD
jgi:hypothetical protein